MIRLTMFAVAITIALTAFGVRALFSDSADEPAMRATTTSSAADEIGVLEQELRNRPDDVDALVRATNAYLVRARETGDPSCYGLAQRSADRALTLAPENVHALVAAGTLANARHDFTTGLMLGERASALEPTLVSAYAVMTDALVELGRYEEATAGAQAMADRRPDFAALSRISYIRELHGDLDGAAEAMEQAVDAGSSVPQDVVWGRVILGNLHLARGDLDAATRQYERAGALLPDEPMALFGLARLAIAGGDDSEAERLLRMVIARRPLPEYLIALGELLESQGRTVEAEEQYSTVRAVQQLFAAEDVDTDLELALFEADHGEPAAAFETARAIYEQRPSVTAADTVAWAAYRAGRIDDARRYMDEALRLGTRAPQFAYHAGVIFQAAGDGARAERYVREAEAMSLAQSPLYAAAAREALARMAVAAAR